MCVSACVCKSTPITADVTGFFFFIDRRLISPNNSTYVANIQFNSLRILYVRTGAGSAQAYFVCEQQVRMFSTVNTYSNNNWNHYRG